MNKICTSIEGTLAKQDIYCFSWVVCLPVYVSPPIGFLSLQRCKLHLQQISWKSQDAKSLVHVVKQDETLTSISKFYGVPILEISSADKDIVDGDLVFEGHHLDVPSPIITYAQVVGNGFEISCLKQVKTWDFAAENGIRSL